MFQYNICYIFYILDQINVTCIIFHKYFMVCSISTGICCWCYM